MSQLYHITPTRDPSYIDTSEQNMVKKLMSLLEQIGSRNALLGQESVEECAKKLSHVLIFNVRLMISFIVVSYYLSF